MQRITHLNNLQSEKKIDYIRHAKISPNKQFLLLVLLKKPHRWFVAGCPLLELLRFADVQSRDMSNENRLTFPTRCLHLKFPFSLMQNPTRSKRIKFPIPVSKHMGPNNPQTPFPTFPCWESWPAYKERTERSCHDSRTSSTLSSLWKHKPYHWIHHWFFFPALLAKSVSAAASFECKNLRSCRANFYFTAKQRDSEIMVLHSQTVVGTNAPDTFGACWDLIWP